ncbi:hypothetical protein AB2F00_25155 (plasmid) [Escherichia coli]
MSGMGDKLGARVSWRKYKNVAMKLLVILKTFYGRNIRSYNGSYNTTERSVSKSKDESKQIVTARM